jgi:hypothetical protein
LDPLCLLAVPQGGVIDIQLFFIHRYGSSFAHQNEQPTKGQPRPCVSVSSDQNGFGVAWLFGAMLNVEFYWLASGFT